MIRLNKLTKYYHVAGEKKYIFKDVDMTIPDKKSVGVLGLNGQGKSTFINILGGSDYPNSGSITTSKSISWPLGLSGSFQSSLTGKDNVKFVCRINSATRSEMIKKIDFVKDFSELGDYFDMPINTYSSGMKSRLSFALSMAFDFDIYLIDEILSVGDKNFREKCKIKMQQKIEKSS
ncbi:MAG: ABC transporter ATP-binding protein, partial [Alphaproteobacteria bacterium]